jgi:tetratricopeptide (TPR) repeat protein
MPDGRIRMRELMPKVCAVVGAAAMYLLVRFADSGPQAQGAAGALVSGKEAFQAGVVGAVLGYGVGYLIALLLPKSATAIVSEDFSRGVSMLAGGDPKSALGAFETSLSQAVGDKRSDSLYNIAVCHVRLGNHDAAIEVLRQAVAIDPNMASDVGTDDDFAPLRSDESFKEIVTAAAQSS